jgi:hypothetical protein
MQAPAIPHTGPKEADEFGQWLPPEQTPPQPRRSVDEFAPPLPAAHGQPAEPGGPAQVGPLASLAGGGVEIGRPEALARPMLTAEREFRPLERPAAVALILLTACSLASGYALTCDSRSGQALSTLAVQNEAIHEHNYSRNILVEHLAKRQTGRLARLKSMAEWMDRRQREGMAVVVPGSDGEPEQKGFVKVDFGDVRRHIGTDITELEEWSPPPPMEGYDGLTFSLADIVANRLPVGLAGAVALAALMLWCFRAYGNLPALGAGPTSFGPLAAATVWLAPLVNLFVPCAVMGELWHGSDPGKLQRPNGLRLPIVGFWWLSVLAAVVLLALGGYRMATAAGVSGMADAMEFARYGDGAAAAVAVVTSILVCSVSFNQSRRRRLLAQMSTATQRLASWR